MKRFILSIVVLGAFMLPATTTWAQSPPSPTSHAEHIQVASSSENDSAPAWLFALLGMGAVAFGLGGVAAAKRRQ